jgi:hypothetical protein
MACVYAKKQISQSIPGGTGLLCVDRRQTQVLHLLAERIGDLGHRSRIVRLADAELEPVVGEGVDEGRQSQLDVTSA